MFKNSMCTTLTFLGKRPNAVNDTNTDNVPTGVGVDTRRLTWT